jgi:O-antigen/teichoic acid export membrane protein
MSEDNSRDDGRLVSSGKIVFGSTAVNALFGFGAIIVLTRVQSSTTLGIYFLFEAVLGIAAFPTDFGLNGAAEKRISEGHEVTQILSTALLLKAFTFLFTSLTIWILRGRINEYLGEPFAYLLIASLGLRELSRLLLRVLRGQFRMELFAVLRVLRRGSWAIIAIFASLLGYEAEGLVIALIAAQLLTAFGAGLAVRPHFTTPQVDLGRSLLKYAVHNAITSISGYVYNWMDTFALGFFVAPGLVAAYEIAWRVTKIGPMIIMSITTTTFPKLSEWIADNEIERASRVVTGSLIPVFLLSLPMAAGAVAISDQLLGIGFGSEYEVAGLSLVILMAGRVVWSCGNVFSRGLHAADVPNLAVRSAIVAIVLNIALNFALIPIYGLAGAAIATSLSFSVKTAIDYGFLKRYLNVSIPLSELGWSSVSASIMYLCVSYIVSTFDIASPASLVGIITSGAIIYFLIIFSNRKIRRQARHVFSDGPV